MNFNIVDLKKKIIYRSTYRGTKEMDKLLSAFTKKYINDLNKSELILLNDLLDIDDENLFNFNQAKEITIKIDKNKITELFKNYKYTIKE
jgi:antitoxin CptB|tara:strand:+ start:549 stop:818 length:270 start_codon:yes stop_codon:yes gene_type:complete